MTKRNKVICIDGTYVKSRGNSQKVGPASLNANDIVKGSHIEQLINQLQSIYNVWEDNNLIDGALISAKYTRIVPKSKRISSLFKVRSTDSPGKSIVGVCFERNGLDLTHVITYFVPLTTLKDDIDRLRKAKTYVDDFCDGKAQKKHIDILNKKQRGYNYKGLAKSDLSRIVVDMNYVSKFLIKEESTQVLNNEAYVVTLYKTNVNSDKILSKIGIDIKSVSRLDDNTYLLSRTQTEILKKEAPYLISMKVKDLSTYSSQDVSSCVGLEPMTIPSPSIEPVVGVIDTPFSSKVYFSKWVEYINMIDPNIPIEQEDYEHGTTVSSIIVDGPSFNTSLEDGCGRFRVKHFGVTTGGRFASSTIIDKVRTIVAENPDIKVWNFSLGSEIEVSDFFVSPAAAQLDKLQAEYDVIFVVAGTNKPSNSSPKVMRVGSPADSLNSLVVNSVTAQNKPASYSRSGPVLSFFNKPDISYYGGDKGQLMSLCSYHGEAYSAGTSYAAPWITRKVAYLVYKMHLSKEVAKALLIDSAAGWHLDRNNLNVLGYGVVPKNISQILTSNNNEIRFVISRTAQEYETYTYHLPIPMSQGKFPFYARATLCYTPECSRAQGVDYTCTEMEIQFGRVRKNKKDLLEIVSINKPKLHSSDSSYIKEEEARAIYRKWDNVKYVCDEIKSRSVPRGSYQNPYWGLSVKMKERLKPSSERSPLRFAVVVTLSEMKGKNRYADFVRCCSLMGWNVQEINMELENDVYNLEQEELVLKN